jgi:hypothetical protein
MKITISPSPDLPDTHSASTTPQPSPSPGPAPQLQAVPTPYPWQSASSTPSPASLYTRAPRSVQIHSGGSTDSNSRTDANTPPLSPQAQKLQQLPKAQQDSLIQQGTSIDAQKNTLLKTYPSVSKQASARMQAWVDETYGPGHDVSKLYLVRYGKDPHGHPSHTSSNPKLDQEGVAAETTPLWQVLQNNMSNGSLFGNDYSANRGQYKIVDASDINKNYNDANGLLDPEKLYNARDKVDFKSEQTASVDTYYGNHHQDVAQWAKQRALTQLEVQHVTGGVSDADYTGIKNLLETGKGGKVFTLATGQYVLAGGLRIELDSGKNFTYLPKEDYPYQPFANSWDATASIRKYGDDPKQATDFVGKYRSLLGDPNLENTNAVQDLQDGSTSKLNKLPAKMTSEEAYKAHHGREYDITRDPFGELATASHRNDKQDVQDGVKSNADIRDATLKKWGNIALEVVMDVAPVLPGGELGEWGEAAAEGSELVGNGIKDGEEASVAAQAGARDGVAEGSAGGVSKAGVKGTGDGNLGAIDELKHTMPMSDQLAARLAPLKADVDPQKLVLNKELGLYQDRSAGTLGGDDRTFARKGGDYYQVKKQDNYDVIVNPRHPNMVTGGVPVELDGEGGIEAFLDDTPGIKGGGDSPQPSTSAPRVTLAQARDQSSARHFMDAERRHPFVRPDGSVDTDRYQQYWSDESYARNFTDEQGHQPFRLANGRGNVDGYGEFMGDEAAARNVTDALGNHPFVRPDGSVNMTAYQRHQMERAARNYRNREGHHQFRHADGSANTFRYGKKNSSEARARRYTNAQGEQPFIGRNGETSYRAFNAYLKQEDAAGQFTDPLGNHPFVGVDGSVDVDRYTRYEPYQTEQDKRLISEIRGPTPPGNVDLVAYKQHRSWEIAARKFTDVDGNHPFLRPDGSADVDAYRRMTFPGDPYSPIIQKEVMEDAARYYRNADGSHPYVHRFTNLQGQEEEFVDVAAYQQDLNWETAADLHIDEHGNHPFRGPNGSVDVAGYKNFRGGILY